MKIKKRNYYHVSFDLQNKKNFYFCIITNMKKAFKKNIKVAPPLEFPEIKMFGKNVF